METEGTLPLRGDDNFPPMSPTKSNQEANLASDGQGPGEREEFSSDELLPTISAMQQQVALVLDTTAKIDKAVTALHASSLTETLLSQLLTVSRETLVKVSVPAQQPADVLEPILRDLIGLVFNVDELMRAQSSPTLEALRGFVVQIAERYGVEFFAPLVGEGFSPSTANAVGTDAVAQRGEEGKVTRIMRPGGRLNGKLLSYPQVRVSKLSV